MQTNPPSNPFSTPSLAQLVEQLSAAIFNDQSNVRPLIADIGTQINQRTAYDIRLSYFSAAAFFDNQIYEYESALRHLNACQTILQRISSHAALAEVWLDRSAVLINLMRWSEAQNALDKARKLLQKNDSSPNLVAIQAQLIAREGLLHLRLDNQGQALEYLLEAEKALLQLGNTARLKDWYILTLVLGGLGSLYERRLEREKSMEAYKRVLPIVEEHQLWPRLAWHYLSAGRVLMAQKNHAEAKFFFERALQIAGKDDEEVQASVLTNLGIIEFIRGDLKQAKQYFDAGVALFSHPVKPTDFDNLAKNYWWQAELLIKSGDPESAEDTYLNAYEMGAKGGQDIYHQRRVALSLAELYASNKMFELAYEWQIKATSHTSDHYIRLREHERQELEARYELEHSRQEAQVARLRVAGLQSRALRAQMNPHFLFNALNAIQGFITSGKDTDAATYLARFAKFMRQTLEYADLEEVKLEEEVNFIEKYLEINRKLRFRDQLNYEVKVSMDAESADLLIPAMIIQPFVENAIEHGLRPKQSGNLFIEFYLTEDEKSLICIIEDDGEGFNKGKAKQAQQGEQNQMHRSRGMEITRERLGLLHNDPTGSYIKIIDLSDIPGSNRTGTRVEVILPLLEES